MKIIWEYSNDEDNKNRYVLGEAGNKILYCIGINPSTAEPNKLDNTLKRVKTIAKKKDYNGWIMLNIYPQRAKDPNKMDDKLNKRIHEINLNEIERALNKTSNPTIWAAWGSLINKRPYLIKCLQDIYEKTKGLGANWVTIGKRCKGGHPHHPIGVSYDCNIGDFKIIYFLIKNKLFME